MQLIKQRVTCILASSIILTSCVGVKMKAEYLEKAVQPVIAVKPDSSHIKVSYNIPQESVYYSYGVDYVVENGVMRVFINRCPIKKTCEPMAKNVLPINLDWKAEVVLPHMQEKVVLVHADGEQVVYQ